jgi:2-oxoisovalerate dehydrogenase E2 component (dihydrolipoyl transacylase)
MARYTFNLPDIGEGIAEAEIVAWYVKPGDWVAEDGRLADMLTDKATVEMESPVAGKVLEVAGAEGDVVAIGSPLVVLEVEGVDEVAAEPEPEQAAPMPQPPEPEPEPAPPTPSVRAEPVEAQALSTDKKSGPSTSSGRTESNRRSAKVLASPAVRARAKEMGIDLADVRPAEDGRIRHADLDAFLSYGGMKGYAPAGVTRGDEHIKVIGMRRRIAENMAASKRNIPHFSYVEECDVTELEKLRADLNSSLGERPRLTMLPLLITAICRALPSFPMINARYDDEEGIVARHGAVHLGMAAQTEAGLMVPVIRDAQEKNLWQLAAEIARLAEAARNGTARAEELSGSTLTLSSLGPLGGIASTPVINRPEVAIIAPNRIVERPMFVPDEMGGERIAKRKIMNLSISCDHRVVDGHDAASFIQAVKKLIERPVLLLAS